MTREVNLQAANPSIGPGTDTSSQLDKEATKQEVRKGTLMKMILAKNPDLWVFYFKEN